MADAEVAQVGDERGTRMHAFVRRVIALRRAHPVFRRRHFLSGESTGGPGPPDAWWFRLDGRRMTQRDWHADGHVLGLFLNGDAIAELDGRGPRVTDDSFLLLFNGHHEDMDFTIPREVYGERWEPVVDTSAPVVDDRPTAKAGEPVTLESRSILVLRRVV